MAEVIKKEKTDLGQQEKSGRFTFFRESPNRQRNDRSGGQSFGQRRGRHLKSKIGSNNG
ncbi:hypothetical protein KJ966_22895 [bacterium]|nr:hypothetical protein [bacterium]